MCSLLSISSRKVISWNLQSFTRGTFRPFSTKKQGKILSKLMHGSDRGKRKWYADRNASLTFAAPSALASTQGQGKESTRRLTVLNKLFMEQITDLMATGEHSEELVGHGIQISRVQVTSDFHGINVFWFARDGADVMEIGRLLKRIAGGLRHELSQLRLIGQVPKLNFVKDKSHGVTAILDGMLRKADFGEDFTPSDRTLSLRCETELRTELPTNVRKEINRLEGDIEFPQEDQTSLPVMRHDTLGLDHDKIMGKIRKSLAKNKLAWAQYREGGIASSGSDEPEVTAKTESDKFKKFLERRNIVRSASERTRGSAGLVVFENHVEESEPLEKDEDFLVDEHELDKKS